MRRILAFFLALTMIFSLVPSAFAASITDGDAENMAVALEVDKTTIAAGESVTVTMTVKEEITRVASFDYRLYFDNTKFDLTDKTLGETNAAMEFDAKVMTDRKTGETYFGIGAIDVESTDEGLTIAAGLLCTMTFTAKEDLAEGTYDFRMESKAISDPEWNDMEASGLKAPFTVTIQNKVPVTSVGLSETAIEMALNSGIKQLYATVTPDNATDKAVTWTSSDETVVTIVDGGNNMCIVYTAGAGEAVITATADGVSASCAVTVYDPATQFPYTLSVNGEDLEVTPNGTTSSCLFGNQSLFDVTVPADATEMLITFDGDSMTVMDDSSGRPNILAQNVAEYTLDLTQGYAEIHLAENSVHRHVRINVAEPETPAVSITLDKTELELSSLAGDYTLTATVTGTDSKVVWATSDATIAEVYDHNGGYVLAVAPGECDITATVDGVTATCHVTVVDPVIDALPYTITVDGTDVEAVSDGTEFCDYGFRLYKFKVTVPADAKTMHLSYDNESAYVFPDHGEEYLLEGGADCDVDLTKGYQVLDLWDAEAMDLLFHLHIEYAEPEKIPVTGVTLSVSEHTLDAIGGEFVLVATITPSNATNQEVVWATSDANVATVENGHIKAVGGGNCEITATVDGVTATCVVTVIDPRETFPFSVSVNGEDLEATYVGTEKCNTSGERALYEVTVPADATSMMIYYDGEAMIIQNEADKEKLAQKVTEYEVDLTAGYEKLCIREDNRIRYHLAINVAEPEKIPVTGVSLNWSEKEIDANGGEFKLSATITPTNATVQDVVWASSDEDVATVDDGLVKAVGAGDCEITATVDGVTATCYVTVYDSSAVFPFTITVGDTDLDPVSDGEEECLYGGILAKWVVTVPADAQSLVLAYDYDSMDVYADDDGDQLCDNAQECTVDLTQGYQFLDIVGNTRNEYYHLYIEVAEPEAPIAPGYTFATSADVTAENGGTATVHVKITGHSDPSITTYNAYDLTLTYDNTKLEFVSGEGADNSDQIKIEKKGDNQIQIVGVGAAKTFDVEVATLTFKTLEEGSADVTIDKVQVSNKSETVTEDVPEASAKHEEGDSSADETPSVSVVVVPYTVTKPDFISGEKKVLYGETYTFSYTDTTNYTYSDLTVKVGGTVVTPTEKDGVYTITNVTGPVEITATQTANSYDVTKPTNVTFSGPDQATYGTDYVFTLTANDGKVIDTVTVATENDPISYTINENGEYVIKGTDISGAFTITVTEKDKPQVVTTTITFTGVEASEVEGGLTQTAEVGKAFNFKLNKVESFTYTAMVGETVLTETEGQYTIPAELVVEGGVTVAITKTEISNLKVEVSPYFNADGSTMFLVIAKDGDKTLAYGDEAMFWSSKYALTNEKAGAYCWLISSADSAENVKAAAVAAIKAAEETVTAPVVAYDCDVNQTTKVDVNDAQLAYDMYMGSYGISESVTMDKFLEADMSTDKVLDVNDVAAIINVIVKGTAN